MRVLDPLVGADAQRQRSLRGRGERAHTSSFSCWFLIARWAQPREGLVVADPAPQRRRWTRCCAHATAAEAPEQRHLTVLLSSGSAAHDEVTLLTLVPRRPRESAAVGRTRGRATAASPAQALLLLLHEAVQPPAGQLHQATMVPAAALQPRSCTLVAALGWAAPPSHHHRCRSRTGAPSARCTRHAKLQDVGSENSCWPAEFTHHLSALD